MANEIINRFNYLIHGQKFPNGVTDSKRIANSIVNANTVFGYIDYLDNGHGYIEENENQDIHANENNGYVSYMGRDKAIDNQKELFRRYPSTFTNEGTFTKDKNGHYSYEYAELLKEMKEHFNKDGQCIWIPIVSLVDYNFAKKMHMYSDEDYSAVLNYVIPKWFRSVGLNPNNMYWLANYHNNTGHPHIHFMMMEKTHTRIRNTFSLNEMKKLKAYIGSAMLERSRLINKSYDEAIKPLHKQMDENKKILHEQVDKFLIKNEDDQIRKEIVRLFYNIDKEAEGKGSLKLNSKNLRPFRKKVDAITDKILNHSDNKLLYDQLKERWKELDEKTKGEFIDKPDFYFKHEDKKLHDKIGNMLLRHKDDFEKWKNDYANLIGKINKQKSIDKEKYINTRLYKINDNDRNFEIVFRDKFLEKQFINSLNEIKTDDKSYFKYSIVNTEEDKEFDIDNNLKTIKFEFNSIKEDKKSFNIKYQNYTLNKLKGFVKCNINNLQDAKTNPIEVRENFLAITNIDGNVLDFQKHLMKFMKANKQQPDNFYYMPDSLNSNHQNYKKFNDYSNLNNELNNPSKYTNSNNNFIKSINNVLANVHLNFGEDVKKALDDYHRQKEQEEADRKWEEELNAIIS